MVLVIPPALFVGGMVVAAVLGWSLTAEAEATHEGSEYIALNK